MQDLEKRRVVATVERAEAEAKTASFENRIVEKRYRNYTPNLSPLPDSSYSPMSYTPRTEEIIKTTHNLEHYLALVKSAVRYENSLSSTRYYVLYKDGGRLTFLRGLHTMCCVQVNTALEMSNIFYLLKVYTPDIDSAFTTLKENGIPTLVETVSSGQTPDPETNYRAFNF